MFGASFGLVAASVSVGATAAGAESVRPHLPPGTSAPIVAPTDVIATPSVQQMGSLTVTFVPILDEPPGNGGLPVLRYPTTCSAPGQPTVSRARSSQLAPAVVFKGLTPGATYTCSVAAGNARGSGPTSSASATLPSLPTVAPTNVEATRPTHGHEVVLSYDPIADVPPDNGGLPILGYRATCTSGDTRRVLIGSGAFTFELGIHASYTCVVAAVNAFGDGPPSAPAVVPSTPGQPTNVTAVASTQPRAVVVSFDPVADATGYQAACQATGQTTRVSQLSAIGPLTVFNLTSGIAYVCVVTPFNDVGRGQRSVPTLPVVPL